MSARPRPAQLGCAPHGDLQKLEPVLLAHLGRQVPTGRAGDPGRFPRRRDGLR